MRLDYDSRTMWTLSGVATRIAQGMGVHKDGTVLGLPPFETEMRRRLWWQINLLDFKSAELTGSAAFGFGELNRWNTRLPANVDDADIWPDMKDAPVEQTRPTEMIVCLLRYDAGVYWKEKLLQQSGAKDTGSHAMKEWFLTATMAERDEFIDELENRLEEKFLRYCDPSAPVQLLTSIIGRIMCKSMRIMAHHPRRYASEKDIPDSERRALWETAIAVMDADNLMHTYRALQRFNWHTDVYFQHQALIIIFSELRARPFGDGKDETWQKIDDLFKNHPDLLRDHRRPLNIAIGNLAMRAWEAREQAQSQDPQAAPWLDPPDFIQQLRRLKEKDQAKARARQSEANQINLISQAQGIELTVQPVRDDMSALPSGQQVQTGNAFDAMLPHDFSMDMGDMGDLTMDWQRWDSLLNDFDVPTPSVPMMFQRPM